MAEIKPAAQSAQQATEVAKTSQIYPTVGKAWINTITKGKMAGQQSLSIIVGNRRENLGSITLNAGDKLFLRPNTKRPGRKDADYQVCLVV